MYTELIGYAAAAVSTSLMLPQVIKLVVTRRGADLSMWMVVLYLLNCLLWLIYGLLTRSQPLIVANSLALVVSVLQLALKLRYGRLPDPAAALPAAAGGNDDPT
jgi:uncharacterized protein with PQ loop repeat